MPIKYLVLAISALVAAGCASQQSVPDTHYYRLQLAAPAQKLEKPLLKGILLVRRFAADGLVADRSIIHSESGASHKLRPYHYHFWAETPATMLQQQMAGFLRDTNAATSVVTPEIRIRPGYILTGHIRRLEQVAGSPAKVIIELELAVKRAGSDRVILVHTYRAEKDAGSRTVSAAVLALNKAMTEIFEKFLSDLGARPAGKTRAD